MRLGLDIGGTSLKAGLICENGKLADTQRCGVDTGQEGFAERLVSDMCSLCDVLLERNGLSKEDIVSVGAGAPGTVDAKNGVFLSAPNLPVHHLPLCDAFYERWGVPLYLGNDANCAALGEYVFGGGKGYSTMMLITLGTGVGSGLVLGGKLYTGFNGAASEAGHVVIQKGGRDCGCGRKGCLEVYTSAKALIKDSILEMQDNRQSMMWEIAGGLTEHVDGTTAFLAAKAGDAGGKKVIDQYLDYLAEGLANIINMLQPECICIGGGISNADDSLLLFPLRERVDKIARMDFQSSRHTVIEKAILGNDAGMIGAALLKDYSS